MKYILIYILNLADYAITVYWTGIHGIQAEINPLMRWTLSVPGVSAHAALDVAQQAGQHSMDVAGNVYRCFINEYPHGFRRVKMCGTL